MGRPPAEEFKITEDWMPAASRKASTEETSAPTSLKIQNSKKELLMSEF